MTYIAGIELQGFRGFSAISRLDLAVPRPDQIGSGLTILVGANNTGKSSVLEAISFLAMANTAVVLTEGKKNRSSFEHIRIAYDYEDGGRLELATEQPGGNQLTWTVTKGASPVLPHPTYCVPSRRPPSELMVPNAGISRRDFSRTMATDFRGSNLGNFSARLAAAGLSRERFDKVMQVITGYRHRWSLEMHEQQTQSYRPRYSSPGDAPHNLESLGDGISRAQQLADAVYDSEAGELILIDEPEQSLHPAAQRRFARYLAEVSTSRQIVLATHSPSFLEWPWLLNGARLARAYRDGSTVAIANLPVEIAESIRGLVGGRGNVHTLGTDAKESLFQEDSLVLVEGQEDVWAYRLIAEELGVQIPGAFFGWGVGGAGNMAALSGLLASLKYKHVVGIVDRDKAADVKELHMKFPAYHYLVSPADDVRTKEGTVGGVPKRGLLEGERIAEEFREDTKKLLDDVIAALRTTSA